MKRYVLFRESRSLGRGFNEELYYARKQNPKSMFPTAIDKAEDAMHFPTARAAYNYGGQERLDDWRVGVR